MPLQPCHADAKALKVEDMMLLVEALLENASSDDKQVNLYFSEIRAFCSWC